MNLKDSLRLGWRRGIVALKSQFAAGVFLWFVALTVWVLYFHAPLFSLFLDDLGKTKENWGFKFDMLTVGLSAGILPSSIMSLQRLVTDPGETRLRRELLLITSHTIMFSIYGVWIDLFYSLQTILFGTGADLQTISLKVAVDQGILCPFIDVPMVQMLLLFIDFSLNCEQFAAEVKRRGMWTAHGILSDWWLPAILTTWLVWIPSLFIVYSLPGALQFIMFSIVMTFWTMIQLVVMGNAKNVISPILGIPDQVPLSPLIVELPSPRSPRQYSALGLNEPIGHLGTFSEVDAAA